MLAAPAKSSSSLTLPEMIRRWGNSASITLLDPKCQIFSPPQIEGAIGYRPEAGCAIVYGDPVCAANELAPLTEAFHHFCREQNLSPIYTTVSKEFADWAYERFKGALVEVAEELVVDPQNDPSLGQEGRMLRKKVKHSIAEGVAVYEYDQHDPVLEKAIEEVAEKWLGGRKGPQIFLSHVHLFEEKTGKRCFYAKQHGKIVGALLMNQLESMKGWVIYLLMATPDAAHGTTEQLVMRAIESLRKEGCRFLSLGGTPAVQMGAVKGLGLFSSWVARSGFNLSKKFFGLDKRRVYWKKYMPVSRSSYLLFSQSKIGFREVVGLLRAFNVSLK